MLAAWAIEAALGWPDALYRRFRHPVVWLGSLIKLLDKILNKKKWTHAVRYLLGVVATLLIVSLTIGAAFGITVLTRNSLAGFALEAIIASSLLASRSLYEHVADIARPLADGDVSSARNALAKIVGRDPSTLDEPAIARAAIESFAEKTSDGVIAPIFWGLLFGLPGLAGYKAINTLDSMIGHRNDRHEAFGGFAARLDDLANFIPARITALLFALAGFRIAALKLAIRDARNHRSLNAGWPEAAMAGALNVRLSGPRKYGDAVAEEPWLNAESCDPNVTVMKSALAIYIRALAIAGILCAVVALGALR